MQLPNIQSNFGLWTLTNVKLRSLAGLVVTNLVSTKGVFSLNRLHLSFICISTSTVLNKWGATKCDLILRNTQIKPYD